VAEVIVSQESSNDDADAADRSDPAAGSGAQVPPGMVAYGIQVPVETVAGLMIQATQAGDVQLLADILTLMWNRLDAVRIPRVLAAVKAYTEGSTSIM
jgi:hypothetical protein